jgi:hypothetical protein
MVSNFVITRSAVFNDCGSQFSHRRAIGLFQNVPNFHARTCVGRASDLTDLTKVSPVLIDVCQD